MAAKQQTEVKVIYAPITASENHELKLVEVVRENKKRLEVPRYEGIPMKIVLKKGDTFTFPKEVFDDLVARKLVRSKEQMAKKEELIKDKVPIYEMEDSEQALTLFDLPYEM